MVAMHFYDAWAMMDAAMILLVVGIITRRTQRRPSAPVQPLLLQ
jgi:hypothetical protein